MVLPARHADIDQRIAFFQSDGDDPVGSNVVISAQRRLLDGSLGGREKQELLAAGEILDRQHIGDLLSLLKFQQIRRRPALAGPAHLRNIVHPPLDKPGPDW